MSGLSLVRTIIFTGNMQAMTAFYAHVLGLEIVTCEEGWVELRAGDCTIALHEWHGQAAEGPVKIVFFAEDVTATRRKLISRGALMGEVVTFRDIDLCDGKDPDGNAFQISSRVTPQADHQGTRRPSTLPGGE